MIKQPNLHDQGGRGEDLMKNPLLMGPLMDQSRKDAKEKKKGKKQA